LFDISKFKVDKNKKIVYDNMAILASGLSSKNYIKLLKDIDLSNVVYIHSKNDERVGRLLPEEIKFLKMKNVEILE
jgi:hypothetical protein